MQAIYLQAVSGTVDGNVGLLVRLFVQTEITNNKLLGGLL